MGIEALQQFGHLTTQARTSRYEKNQYLPGAPTTTATVEPSYKKVGYQPTVEDFEKAQLFLEGKINAAGIDKTQKIAAHQGRTDGKPNYEQHDREFSPVVLGSHLGGKFDSNNCDWYAC